MSHVRQQIRDEVVTLLTGLATTGNNVFRHRYYPLANANLPGLIIYTEDESQAYATIGPDRTISRTLTLRVEAYVQATANYDNILDNISIQVEEAMAEDRTLGGLAKDTKISSFASVGETGGDQPALMGRFEISITYHTKESNPEVAV